jgi:hypothetical protein
MFHSTDRSTSEKKKEGEVPFTAFGRTRPSRASVSALASSLAVAGSGGFASGSGGGVRARMDGTGTPPASASSTGTAGSMNTTGTTVSNTNVHAIVKAQIVFLLSTLTEENFEQNQLQIRTVSLAL